MARDDGGKEEEEERRKEKGARRGGHLRSALFLLLDGCVCVCVCVRAVAEKTVGNM